MMDNKHLVITVHGIRTYGDWQDELKKLLEAAEPGVTIRLYRYGFFSSLAFLIPPLRWLVGRQFRSFFLQEVRSAPEGARIDLVAHSFGTYLAASALRFLPEGKKINTVIFAASVLPASFPWYKYLQAGSVGRVVNECGWDDSVLVLCQSAALLMGMAGRIGFHGMVGDRFVNRYYRWGHGGYFDPHQQFMRDQWVPLLTGDSPLPQHDERPPLTTVGGIKLFLLSNMHVIKVAAACLLLMSLVGVPVYLFQLAGYKKNVERINHIALLTNAQEILNSDPTHVRELLKIDAEATGNEHDFEQVIPIPGTDDGLDVDTHDEEAGLHWWQLCWDWLTGMSHDERESYRARRAHHLANRQLVSGKESVENNRAKAQAHFETALSSYAQVNDKDLVRGSYALCLLDYGQLLDDTGRHDDAIKEYKKAREHVFLDAKGQNVKGPPSLAVDSLLREAESRKSNRDWDNALECLKEAVKTAEEAKSDALLCDAHNASGWYHMERLEVNEAVADFIAAKNAGEELVENGEFVYQIRLFHIRHGLALADRLKGKSREAYEQFDQIVRELRHLMLFDLKYTPKQRRDLRDRLLNSMERQVDVMLFARYEPAAPVAGNDHALPGSHSHAVTNTDEPSKVEVVFQEAIKLVGNDDLDLMVRLLYKKVIARFVAELEQGRPMPIATPGARHKSLGTIDLEFDEANRALETLATARRKELKSYHEIADACMGVREAATKPDGYFATPAVEKLRTLTAEYSTRCDGMNRENVEMLLLALEILLNPKIERDTDMRALDATRMMAVIGQTTKVASNPELAPYFDRFQKIALGQQANDSPQSRKLVPTAFESSPSEKLLFYLWLGPGLELKLTRLQVKHNVQAEPPFTSGPRRTDLQALSKAP
jgi:hypothetical protein